MGAEAAYMRSFIERIEGRVRASSDDKGKDSVT
jgi:hypothetical protein